MGRHAPDAAQAAALAAAAASGGQDPAGPGEQAAAAQATALAQVFRAVAQEKLGDIMFMPPGDALCIGDVSVVSPCAGTYCSRAARENGSAAVHHVVRDVRKRNDYRAYDPDAYSFVPLSHETHGRLGQPAMGHLNRLATVVSWCGTVKRTLFATNALRRLSVALCKGNAYVLRAGLQSLAGITGRAVVRARARPSAMNE